MFRACLSFAVVLGMFLAAPVAAKPQRTPMAAKLVGPATVRPGETINVKLEITRTVVNRLPVLITWQLPPGAKLEGPMPPRRIVDRRSKTLAQVLTLSFAAVPERDLVATVEVRGPAYGVMAKAVYRFGRPAPTLPDASEGAPGVKVNGKNLGTAVPVK